MAIVITNTSTVDITVIDSANYEYVYKINNPKEELTMTEIRNAYNNVIENGLLYSKNDYPITTVARATTVATQVTKTDIE